MKGNWNIRAEQSPKTRKPEKARELSAHNFITTKKKRNKYPVR
jgi:hypothetical protein